MTDNITHTRGNVLDGLHRVQRVYAFWMLLRYLQEYHRSYPGVRVRILNGTSRRVMNYLHGGTCDLAFVTTDEPVEGFDNHLCLKTHTSFVAAADYPVDFDRAYTLAEISAMPLILLEREAGSRRFLENCFLKEGLRLEPEIELASYELLISLAGIGLGVAGVTEEFSQDALDRGIVRKIKLTEPLPERAVSMLTLKNTGTSMAARKFMELIQS